MSGRDAMYFALELDAWLLGSFFLVGVLMFLGVAALLV